MNNTICGAPDPRVQTMTISYSVYVVNFVSEIFVTFVTLNFDLFTSNWYRKLRMLLEEEEQRRRRNSA